MYFVVIYALVAAFLHWNRVRHAAVAAFVIPFPAVLLLFCSYNYRTMGKFTISPFAEANLAGATALFWEPDPRLPPEANRALLALPDSYRQMGITEQELLLERTSWDTGRLFDLYAKAYNRLVWSAGWGSGTKFGGSDYLHNRDYIRQVSIIAIKRHPDLYAKYVWVNLVTFFSGIGYKFDIYSSLLYRSRGNLPGEASAYQLGASGPAAAGVSAPAPAGGLLESVLQRLLLAWQSFHGVVFQSLFWTWAYFAMLVLSAGQLLRFRGRHLGAFLLFVLTLIPLGASLVVCLVEVATDRYSYPTQFICYLSVALAPLLWRAALPAAAPAPSNPAPPLAA
jgi:hypothetical protein